MANHSDMVRSVFEEALSMMESFSSNDRLVVEKDAEQVIGGFLNLGMKEGWEEFGNDPRVGAAFVRFILHDYYQSLVQANAGSAGQKTILKRTLDCFEHIGDLISTPFSKKPPEDGHRPKNNRARYDEGVKGWQKHSVSRMVGNVASRYNPRFPFFEILVNSERPSADDEICSPFLVSIHENENALDKRRASLASLKQFPSELAYFTFYSTSLTSPEKFLETTHLLVGPNAKRLIEGLVFLNEVKLYAQKTGNCWIKQPMRCLLASLYLETFSVKKDLSPPEAWKLAVLVYKEIQKKSGIPLVQELLSKISISDHKRASAQKVIDYRLSF